ncbi:hypothetical protein [Hymenobacter seoulensis]
MSSGPASQVAEGVWTLGFYTLTYQDNPPLLRGSNSRALSPEEITETCELLLIASQQLQCPYWLLDGRANARHQPRELHEWMREDYFPRVRAALGQRPQVAFVVAPEIWHGLPARGYEAPPEWSSFSLHANWFQEEAPALAWLQQQREAHG